LLGEAGDGLILKQLKAVFLKQLKAVFLKQLRAVFLKQLKAVLLVVRSGSVFANTTTTLYYCLPREIENTRIIANLKFASIRIQSHYIRHRTKS
jgi:hypothetical protein